MVKVWCLLGFESEVDAPEQEDGVFAAGGWPWTLSRE